MKCVTSGSAYTDIDAFACAIGYAELCGCDAVLPGKFNSTIPKCVRDLGFKYLTDFTAKHDKFVIVDMSDPRYLPECVKIDQVEKVYDHHHGFASFWQQKGVIESVGACATVIFELFKNGNVSGKTANLLYTAIFANTLNFKAKVTTERDLIAAERLKSSIELPDCWIERYYNEVEEAVLSDFEKAVTSDMKILPNGWVIAQIELYDAKKLLENDDFMKTLKRCMDGHDHWLLTIPSISEGVNYLTSNSNEVRNKLKNKMGASWNGKNGKFDNIYLRKEIIHTIFNKSG